MTARNIERLFNVVSRSLFRRDSHLGYARTLDALDRMCAELMTADTDETIWSIGECGDTDLGALIEGAYWFMCDYHGGQWSPEYATQCALGRIFSPGMSSLEEDTSGHDVYRALEACQKGLDSF